MKEKLVTFLAENSETVKDSAEKVNDFFKQCFLKRRHTIFFKR